MSDEDDHAYQTRLAEARGLVLNVTRNADDTTASYAERVRTAMSGAAREAQDTTNDLTRAAGDAVGGFTEHVAHSGTQLKQGTHSMAQSTRDTASRSPATHSRSARSRRSSGPWRDRSCRPSSRRKPRLRRPPQPSAKKGRDLAQDFVDRGTQVGMDTLDAVKDSAGAHGLTVDKPIGDIAAELKSGDLAGHVKAVTQETLQAGQGSASRQLAPQDDA